MDSSWRKLGFWRSPALHGGLACCPGRATHEKWVPGHAFPDQPLHRRHHRLRAAAGRRDCCGSTAGFRPAASPPGEPAPPRHQGRDLPTHLEEPHRLGCRPLQPHQDAAPGAGRRRHRAGLHPHRPPPRLPPRRARRGARRRRGRLAARPTGGRAGAGAPEIRRPRGGAESARHPARQKPAPAAGRSCSSTGEAGIGKTCLVSDLRVVVHRIGPGIDRPCAVHRALRHQRALSADLRGHAAPGRRDRRRQARDLPEVLRADVAGADAMAQRRRTAAGRCRGGHPATHAARAGPGPRSDVGRQADRPVAGGPALERSLDARRHLLPGAPAGERAPDGDRLLPPGRGPRAPPPRAGGQGSHRPPRCVHRAGTGLPRAGRRRVLPAAPLRARGRRSSASFRSSSTGAPTATRCSSWR